MSWFVYAISSALLVALASMVEKKVLIREHAAELTATLGLIGFVMALPFFWFIDYKNLSLIPLVVLFFTSSLGLAGYLLVAKAMRHMDLSEVSPFLVFSPALTSLLAWLFLGEVLSLVQITGIILLLLGAYVLETAPGKSLLAPFRAFKISSGIHLLLLSQLLYSVAAFSDRVLLTKWHMPTVTYLGFVHLFLALQSFIILALFYNGYRGIKHGLKVAGWPIALVAVLALGYRFALVKAVQVAFVGLAVAVKRLSILFSTIVGGNIFHERNLLRRTVASFIMIGGAVLIAMT